uniref:Uncharacterized protein n=1 Tax=Arundo donax TaxID=35708 RepID=A0A0A9DKI0_ARUDO
MTDWLSGLYFLISTSMFSCCSDNSNHVISSLLTNNKNVSVGAVTKYFFTCSCNIC